MPQFQSFAMERMMPKYEQDVEYNLSGNRHLKIGEKNVGWT